MFKNLWPGAIGINCTMQEGIELAKTTGFEGLEPNFGEAWKLANEHSTDYVKGLFDDAGIRIGGWSLPVNWRGSDADYYDHLSKLPQSAKLAAEIGCDRCTTTVMPGDNGRPFKENWDFHVKRLRPAAEILKDYGHALGIEFIGPRKSRAPFKQGFVYNMDATLGLCAAIGTGNVGLLYDAWHVYTSFATMDDVKKLTKDDIVYVHINDAPAGIEIGDQYDLSRSLPGETGIIPLAETLRFLNDIGYDGPLSPEPFNKRVNEMAPAEAARTIMDLLDKVWTEAGLT